MTKDQAEIIALQAVVFLVKNEDLLKHFLTNSGLTYEDFHTHFHELELLGGILDAILADDAILLAFCSMNSLSPETLLLARRMLPGATEGMD